MLGAPEIRFFIAIHLIGYFYTVYCFDYSRYKGILRRNIVQVAVAFLVFAFLWIGVLSSILASNAEKTLLIDDRNIYRTQDQGSGQ